MYFPCAPPLKGKLAEVSLPGSRPKGGCRAAQLQGAAAAEIRARVAPGLRLQVADGGHDYAAMVVNTADAGQSSPTFTACVYVQCMLASHAELHASAALTCAGFPEVLSVLPASPRMPLGFAGPGL